MNWLTPDLAARMAMLAVENIGREFPNAPGHRLDAIDDMRRPRELHPAFLGSYDWHSSVHQHWPLVRLLRLERAGTAAADARTAVGAHLSASSLSVEAAYLRDRPTFERTPICSAANSPRSTGSRASRCWRCRPTFPVGAQGPRSNVGR